MILLISQAFYFKDYQAAQLSESKEFKINYPDFDNLISEEIK